MASLFTIHSELRYEIVRKIFEGGMGIIYEAEQHGARNFVKRVAIKVVRLYQEASGGLRIPRFGGMWNSSGPFRSARKCYSAQDTSSIV